MTEEVMRYESLRNGKIGTVVSRTDSEVVLDIEGNHKTVKLDNLKRWYKPCGIIEQADVDKENELAEKKAKLDKMVSKPDKPNGDEAPKEDCSKLATKIISYLEKNGCVTKKTCSYVRVRLNNVKRNLMELWYGKKLKGIKIVVRSEAVMGNKKLYDLGRTVPPTHMYTLDHIYKFNNSSDIADIYAIIDTVIVYEKNNPPKPHPGSGKRGTGKINGRESLAYKRKNLGIKSDDEKQSESETTVTEESQQEQPVAVES